VFYVVVEKILSGDEALPDTWPVSGTTGYDFLNTVNNLFVDASGLPVLSDIYAQFIGLPAVFGDVRPASLSPLTYRNKCSSLLFV